jgi:predicted translin family RNA/ssDNA-binding protein
MKAIFMKIKKKFEKFSNEREKAILNSREVIALSKKVIYALHRGDMKAAKTFMVSINQKKLKLPKSGSYDANITSVAYQEYVEAVCYYEYITKGKISNYETLKVEAEDYLGGLADLTGELVRKAVALAIENQVEKVSKIKEFVAEIYNGFLQLNLRNSDLRRKSDAIRWNLNKLEDTLLSLKLR